MHIFCIKSEVTSNMTIHTSFRYVTLWLVLFGANLPIHYAVVLNADNTPNAVQHYGNMTDVFHDICALHDVPNKKNFASLKSLKFPSISQDVGELDKLPYSTKELKSRLKYDPETRYNASGLISSKGYPVEDHEVKTEDGFILGLQRIPHGISNKHTVTGARPAVLLQHGLLCSSTNWVSNLANESLGFILADAGYDVWLGNVRGNTYSLKHAYLKNNSREFWYWSWDEMAKYDLPAMIHYVLNVTGEEQLFYVGHSQGTIIAFAAFSQDQELAKKVKTFFALAPVITGTHTTSLVREVFDTGAYIEILDGMEFLGYYQFLPQSAIFDYLGNSVCDEDSTIILCQSVLFFVAGYSREHMNASRIPVYVSNTPAGTSIWDVKHWGQTILSGNFSMYDYGCRGNMKHYGQTTPPLYHVEDMQVPTALFWGGSDILATPTDVKQIIPKIKNLVFNKEIPTYGHLDFTWATDAAHNVYSDIIRLLKNVN